MSSDALLERVDRLERELSVLRAKVPQASWSIAWRLFVLLWLVSLSIYTFTPAHTPFERRLHLDALTFQEGEKSLRIGPGGVTASSTGIPLVGSKRKLVA